MSTEKIIPFDRVQLKRWEKQLEERSHLAAPYDDPSELWYEPIPANIVFFPIFRPEGKHE